MTLLRDLGLLAGREHDVLVIGGGICGAATAWDAAQRGLRVAVVEARDFASGVSANSMKTVHGGLRHLQRADLAGLRESVRERRALLRIAPDLVRPLRFVAPTYGHGARGREAMALGLRLYDLLSLDRNRGVAPDRAIGAGRVLSRNELMRLVPGLSLDAVSGGVSWTDAQVESPERLTLAFLRAAASGGAAAANRAPVTGLLRCGARVVGARVRDEETGLAHEVRARFVVNACGPDVAALAELAGARPRLPLVRGMNLVLRRAIVGDHGVGALSGGRYLFLVPWRGRTIVGTAYDEPGPEDGEASFLRQAASAFPWAGIEPRDVALVHRGRVPGRAGTLANDDVVLDHETEDGTAGLISVQLSKLTTARAAAERAVDVVCRRIRRETPGCRTASTLLPVPPSDGSLEERARRAVREEMARHLTDAVLRRLDLGTAGPPAAADVDVVCSVMASELGWDAARQADERRELDAVYPRLS